MKFTSLKWLFICSAILIPCVLAMPRNDKLTMSDELFTAPANAEESTVIPIPGHRSDPRKDWEAIARLREDPVNDQDLMQEAVLRNDLGMQDWILIATQDQVGWHEYSDLVSGNFDDDPQQELLFQFYEGDKLVKLSGEVLSFDPPRKSEMGLELIFDFDGDGRADFLEETKESLDSAEDSDFYEFNVYNLRSELIGKRKLSHGQFWHPVLADFDGDSRDDYNAVLIRSEKHPVSAVTSDSLMIELTETGEQHYIINCTGDIDGDGRDELIVSMYSNTADEPDLTLWACGIDNQMTRLETPAGELSHPPYFCCDLNGDGTDELLSSEYCTDIVNHTVVRMEWPYNADFPFMEGDDLASIELEGRNYMAATPQFLSDGAVSLVIWADGGNLVYYRQFGEAVQDMQKVRYEGRDRILVLTTSRLLMSP